MVLSLMLVMKANLPGKDKVIWCIEMVHVIKIFMTKLKQRLLPNSNSPVKFVGYMMKTLLSTPFPASMVTMTMRIQEGKYPWQKKQ